MYFSIPLWISLHSSVASESPLKSLRPSFNVLRQGYVFQHPIVDWSPFFSGLRESTEEFKALI